MKNEKRYWLDESRNVDKIFWGLCILCVLLVAADLFYHKHAEFSWEDWFGFYGFYGFVSCIGLVLLAKQIRKLLMRKENYYDR